MADLSAADLHRDALVIDMTCPLAKAHRYLDWWIEGGATAIAPTIRGFSAGAGDALAQIGGFRRLCRERDDLMLIETAADLDAARATGRLGLILHSQGGSIVEDRLDLVDGLQAAGLRVLQLCYNTKNLIGDGAGERTDSGLSDFGVRLIGRLNAARVAVDCAHTGHRTSMDAVEHSAAPVIISHANARAVHDNLRNVEDELIRAVAGTGGVIGTVGFPSFLTAEGQPSLDAFIDDIAYKADLVGIDHTGLGIDYYLGQWGVEDDAAALARYEGLLAEGLWRPGQYPPPPYKYPEGIETPRTLPALTERLLARGFSTEDIRKVLGENWRRVFAEIWGG
ncbi:MAG: membrane dipeptidase [Pseudomonadota bacterium]